MRPDCYCQGECTCPACAEYDPARIETECCECLDCNCTVLVAFNPQPLDDRPMLVAGSIVSLTQEGLN